MEAVKLNRRLYERLTPGMASKEVAAASDGKVWIRRRRVGLIRDQFELRGSQDHELIYDIAKEPVDCCLVCTQPSAIVSEEWDTMSEHSTKRIIWSMTTYFATTAADARK